MDTRKIISSAWIRKNHSLCLKRALCLNKAAQLTFVALSIVLLLIPILSSLLIFWSTSPNLMWGTVLVGNQFITLLPFNLRKHLKSFIVITLSNLPNSIRKKWLLWWSQRSLAATTQSNLSWRKCEIRSTSTTNVKLDFLHSITLQ